MIFNLFLIIYAFKQRDLISLNDTIISSNVSKKSRYIKKNFILLKIYDFKQSDLISLNDTITSSKVSKKIKVF